MNDDGETGRERGEDNSGSRSPYRVEQDTGAERPVAQTGPPPRRPAPLGVDFDRQLLRAELTRIEVRIRHRVWRWRQAGRDPGDVFRGLYINEAEIDRMLTQPLGEPLGTSDNSTASEEEAFLNAEASIQRRVRELSAAAEAMGQVLRLPRLASTFSLDRFDVDALLVCLAPALDLRFQRLYAYLQDDVAGKQSIVQMGRHHSEGYAHFP